MLRKEHLRYTLKGGRVEPHLVAEKGSWPRRLQKHLELLELSLPLTLAQLQDMGKVLIAQHPRSRKLLVGHLSILEKSLEMEEVNEKEFASRRSMEFDLQVEKLRKETEEPLLPPSPEKFLLYGDLESERKVVSLGISKGIDWVRRYNMELVQGITRLGDRVKIDWPELSPERWRFLCRQLRFWGLLFQLDDDDKSAGKSLTIEGPLSHFGGHQTYRDRIAALVGVLPQMEPFRLRVNLRLEGKRQMLDLSESSGLRSRNRKFFDHEPEAWKVFKQAFRENLGEGWSWSEETSPQGGWRGWSVPDAILISPQGQRHDLHHFQAHQQEALIRVRKLRGSDDSEVRKIWILERPLEESIEFRAGDLIFPYRSLPSGKKLASIIMKS